MKLVDLINTYSNPLHDDYSIEEAEEAKECVQDMIDKDKLLNSELPDEITDFIKKFHAQAEITPKEFKVFSEQLLKLDVEIQQIIIHLINILSVDIIESHNAELNKIVNIIETNVKQGKKIPQNELDHNDKEYIRYRGLLNSYQLFTHYIPIRTIRSYGNIYPLVPWYFRKAICVDMILTINALRLVGKLPHDENFQGINLSKPYYPLHLDIINEEKIPLREGIKNSEEYYPYKLINKIYEGDSGNNTLVATNGRKIMFVRGVDCYSNTGVLASKIASLISPLHFSSESLFSNHLAASKFLPTHVCSLADPKIKDEKIKYVDANNFFPGSGIVDEVCNFTGESDYNSENFGFSSLQLNESFVTKIDFDRCYFGPADEKGYVTNMLGVVLYNTHYKNIQKNLDYTVEKFSTRLKLSMLTDPLFCNLADKAFIKDCKDKEKAINECIRRSHFVLELIIKDPQFKNFFIKHPNIMDQCSNQIAEYITKHFHTNQRLLLQSLEERVKLIKTKIDVVVAKERKHFPKLHDRHHHHKEEDVSKRDHHHSMFKNGIFHRKEKVKKNSTLISNNIQKHP